ncbi:MAG: hypothetical protein HXX15_00770 [Rhodopseudomonas sp.]|uniref:hypothetical protein n=1 Tax=Rhodopseudomonas sp. TaxID=1078 RepID=UPI0017F79DA5|nr:hypothetical protein [Rhodopseudomonas sp.]NVN84592.1 hypothetical protein [Rhodopseudomonas sp.]
MTAARPGRGASLLRQREPQQHNRVTYVELFFDLVFVFAITQRAFARGVANDQRPHPVGRWIDQLRDRSSAGALA